MRISDLPPGEHLVFGASVSAGEGVQAVSRLTDAVRVVTRADRPVRVELKPLGSCDHVKER
jgi:hypothetical protein